MSKEYVNRHRNAVGATVEAAADKAISSFNSWKRMEIKEGESNVGVSISIGRSEDYGRNKYSITINHSVSCGQDADSKAAAFEEAASFCMEKAQNLEKEVVNQFYPTGFKGNR
jgi:hypothetical protein